MSEAMDAIVRCDRLIADIQEREKKMSDFEKELADLLNRHSMENGSNTADWILARYMTGCLRVFDSVVKARDSWYGISPYPGKERQDEPLGEASR